MDYHHEFKPGDLARLKSGGGDMAVCSVGMAVGVLWKSDFGLEHSTYPIECVMPVEISHYQGNKLEKKGTEIYKSPLKRDF
jgi:hypothetical protein